MSEQIEREIAHLDTEPLTLMCDRGKCRKRATWMGLWSCCGADDVRCATHASTLNAVVKAVRPGGQSVHEPCGAVITDWVRLTWVAVGK